jgi:DNA-directed RNA polymerase subunit RPC12/RpoP
MNSDLIEWTIIPCLHCNAKNHLRDYHHSYQMVKKEFYLTCPRCSERMILNGFNVEKERDVE